MLTPVPGATPRYDDDGNEIVDVMTCGTCGRSWNDAAVSDITPAPSGRCPFEYDHESPAYTAWQLALMAGCADPDSDSSPGADFLNGIESSVRESIEYNEGEWDDDAAGEIADGAVPVYTYRMWQTFTDLAAWDEDPSEIGAENGDMAAQAAACLYLIANRLAYALGEEIAVQS